jgi:hypothetical protein
MNLTKVANGYLESLVEFPTFDYNEFEKTPFVYDDIYNNINLSKLKNKYNIKNISNKESILHKTMDIMNWVHKELFCTKKLIKPNEMNSLCILKNRQKGQMLCFYYAIVMNEILLSLGIKSRVIECFPKMFDMDCHMAVTVLIPEVNQWCFFDPTFNTLFFDETKKPLSIDEIRKKYLGIIDGKDQPKFLSINIKKEWELVLVDRYETYNEWYFVYMLKNIFRFSSPLKSTFGFNKDEKNVILNPIGYNTINEYDNNHGKILYTNNMQAFIK